MASGSAHRRLAVQKNGSGEQRRRDETTRVALCHKTSRKGTDFQTQGRKNQPEGGGTLQNRPFWNFFAILQSRETFYNVQATMRDGLFYGLFYGLYRQEKPRFHQNGASLKMRPCQPAFSRPQRSENLAEQEEQCCRKGDGAGKRQDPSQQQTADGAHLHTRAIGRHGASHTG